MQRRWELPRNLIEELSRAMAPYSTMVSTMRRLFEKYQCEMTNYIVSHMPDVIRLNHGVDYVNAVNDVLSGLGSSNQLLQGIFAIPGYIPSPPLYNNEG